MNVDFLIALFLEDAEVSIFSLSTQRGTLRWLRHEPASAQVHRAVDRLGQHDRHDPPWGGARPRQGRLFVRPDEGGRQPQVLALAGRIASADRGMWAKTAEIAAPIGRRFTIATGTETPPYKLGAWNALLCNSGVCVRPFSGYFNGPIISPRFIMHSWVVVDWMDIAS